MFPQKNRVPRERIKNVLFEGSKIQTELFLLRKKQNGLKNNRFAVIVSKKVEKTAVGRHYLKRLYKNLITDIFKKETNTVKSDYVFVLNKKTVNADKNDIISLLINLTK